MEFRVVLVALCCAWVQGNTDPTNFTPRIGDDLGDYVNVELQWTAGACLFSLGTPKYSIYAEDATQESAVLKGSTTGTKFTVKGECWDSYNFTLKTTGCWFGSFDDVASTIKTPPGNPHKVADVKSEANSTSVSMDIDESPMPRIVDYYNFTLCEKEHHFCFSRIAARNAAFAGKFSYDFHDLKPGTVYDFNVTAVIAVATNTSRKYESEPFKGRFTTDHMDLPKPDNFSNVVNSSRDGANASIRWTMNANGFDVLFYNYSLLHSKEVLILGTTNETEVSFSDLPFFADLTLVVVPVFNFSGSIDHGLPADFEFSTPAGAVGPVQDYAFAPLNVSNVLLGWNPPKNIKAKVVYEVVYWETKNTTILRKTNDTRLNLFDLDSNTTYFVNITAVVSDKTGSVSGDVFVGNFTTLEKDWPSVEKIKGNFVKDSAAGALFNIS